MLNILLLIVWIYLSIAFTLFFITLNRKDDEVRKVKLEMIERDKKLNYILELCSNINEHLEKDKRNLKLNKNKKIWQKQKNK